MPASGAGRGDVVQTPHCAPLSTHSAVGGGLARQRNSLAGQTGTGEAKNMA